MIEMLFNNKFQRILVLVGCVIFQMKIILALAEKQDWEGEYQKDKTEQKMFELFAEGIEDLYTKVLEPYIREHAGFAGCVCNEMMTQPHCHLQRIQRRMTYILAFSATSDFDRSFTDVLSTERLEETHESFGPRSLFFLIMNELPHWLSMKSQESLDEDHYKHLVLGSYAGMLGDPNYINTIVRQKGKTTGCKCKVIHEDGTVFFHGQSQDQVWRNMRAKYLLQIAPTKNNLGVGKQILLPRGDFQVGEPMDQGGSASRSAEVPRCLPSGKEPPTTEAKDETMEASSTYGRRRAWFWRR